METVRLDPDETTRARWKRPVAFGRLLDRAALPAADVSLSLDRNAHQDIVRTGDGLHADWLDTRVKLEGWTAGLVGSFDPFHQNMLKAESLAYSAATTRFVMANSEWMAVRVGARYSFPRSRVHVIRNPVDASAWDPAPLPEVKSELGLGPDDLLALFVGNGWKRKGLAVAAAAVNAWRARSGARAVLVAAGEREKGVAATDTLRLCGSVRGGELARWYRGADLLLLPTWYDPFANVTLEALACGLPVVTTPFNGGGEVLQAGTGRVLSPEAGDIAWADAIDQVRNGSSRERCRAVAESCSLDKHVGELGALLQRAVTER